MKIIESLIKGKKSQETCEDAIVLTDHFAAVVDGCTSKTPTRIIAGKTNGQLAAEMVRSYISTLKADCNVEDFCQAITKSFHQLYEQNSDISLLTTHPEMRATASAAIFSTLRHEVWLVGDCQAIIEGTVYENSKPYEHDIAAQRARMIRLGTSPHDARKAIEPLLVKAMKEGQNKHYAVIDGFPIWMNGIQVIRVPKSTTELVLATDGYPFLMPTLEESERRLAVQLQADPQNIDTFIATKGLVDGNCSFDDRSYMRIAL